MQRLFPTYYFLWVILASCFVACEPTPIPEDHIVVEGWIEPNEHPVVILHRSYALAGNTDTLDVNKIFEEQMIAFGKVVIDDGENQVILTGRLDTNYMPPYIYTTAHMIGETGKTYTLTATYKDYCATATSTILDAPHLDSITIQKTVVGNMRVEAHMSHFPTHEKTYYALYTCPLGEQQFKLCPLGTFSSDQAIDGKIKIKIHRKKGDIGEIITPDNFDVSDSIFHHAVKLARIEHSVYQFLDSYSAQLFSQGMLFMSAYGNIPTNIQGGLGYFAGLGSNDYVISVEKDTTYVYAK